MEKIDCHFPASAAVHGGRFRDQTLRQFAERRPVDPDLGTVHEGTVNEIPGSVGEMWDAQIHAAARTPEWITTSEPKAIAFAPQNEKRRRALTSPYVVLWWCALSPTERRDWLTVNPALSITAKKAERRVRA